MSSYNLNNIRTLLTEGFTDDELRRLCYDVPDFRPVYDELASETGKAKIIDRLIEHTERHLQLDALLTLTKAHNPARYEKHYPYYNPTQSAHLFICYKRHAEPDQKLAIYLHQFLTSHGHQVFIDQTLRTGDGWLEQIDGQIQASDFLIVLLSKELADSEMVQAEVSRAYEYRKRQGRPHALPVRLAYEGLLPYTIAAFLNPQQYVVWQSEADNERVTRDILAAIEGRLPLQAPIQARPVLAENILSEDGRPVLGDEILHPPLPKFDPRFVEELAVPGGAVTLRDKFYVEREADIQLKREIVKWSSTITIRAPRQTGKTSLLMRGIRHARQSGAKVVSLDFQGFGHDQLASPDIFLREFATAICHEFRLDPSDVEKSWQGAGSLGAQNKLTYFLEDIILPKFETPLILAMDEGDCLLQTPFYQDFFGLIRSWHNRRAQYEEWEKLNLVMVISTEPYLLIDDINQSPFNVGLKFELNDFSEAQVGDLNRRHGSPVAERDLSQLMSSAGWPSLPHLVRLCIPWSRSRSN